MMFFEILLVLLAGFGLACLLWLGLGRLLLPVRPPVRVVLNARGDGGELEQAVRALLWLRQSGLWRGTVILRDEGLDPQGLALAHTLSLRAGVKLVRRPDGGASHWG